MAVETHLQENGKPLDIVVVGGSCAGLFTGILLKKQGHNVRILEAATSSQREGMAAGIGLSAQVQRFFEENDQLKGIPFGTPSKFMNIMDEHTESKQKIPIGYESTSWDAIYYRLRANFDGYKSLYCPTPPELQTSGSVISFDTGIKATGVEEHGEKLKVNAQDVMSGEVRAYLADYVVAADGASSTVRRQLLPDLKRSEQDYMIWRGVVPTTELHQELLDKIESNTTIYPIPSASSYMVLYTIPGQNGALEDGARYINLVMYDWPGDDSIESILTDTDNYTHRTTLPKGKMRPEVWEKEVAKITPHVHPDIAPLLGKIKLPFASVVSSFVSPKCSYFDDRLFLVGEALAQVQPNLGQGTNMAVTAAMCVADIIAGKKPASDMDQVIQKAAEENKKAIDFAARFLNNPAVNSNGRYSGLD